MNNCLILLTNYYPFYKGEEYLESEIEHLSKNFKDIYIISTMVSDNMEQTRKVPKNVTVLPIGINHSKLGKLKMVVNQFNNINKDKEKRQVISKDSKNKIVNKLYCYYFESRAMDVYEKLERILGKYDFEQYTNITIYSYWLYITARVGVELKNKYFKDKNTYTISRAHRYDLYEYAAPLKYLPQREYLLSSIDRIYPCSQDGVDVLNETYPKYKNKIEVGRLGTISTNILGNLDNKELNIVSCSALRKVKRVDLLIETLYELEKLSIPYKWTHIGDGPEFEKIKELATNKLDNRNFKFEGFLKNKDVLRWYEKNKVTVFVNLSESEGVPVSIMEAMSIGVPIVATDVGGTREIVKNEYNGYLIDKECKIARVVESFIKLYNMNEDEYKKLSKNSFEIWSNLCDANKIYSNFANKLSNS
ncbi:glycosyltransferase [Romboutsia ilealis]|uniref:glycosyltransferase n=1 Tax=Romboutsia ilealis TaxID=1115758 RepID=UPI0025A5FAF8|nr:glycosyltransferase [Romboutsia ilealis]